MGAEEKEIKQSSRTRSFCLIVETSQQMSTIQYALMENNTAYSETLEG